MAEDINSEKAKALFKERPFLARHVNLDQVKRVHVARIGLDLLNRPRREMGLFMNLVGDFLEEGLGWIDDEVMLLLDKEGDEVIRLWQRYYPPDWGFWKRHLSWEGGVYLRNVKDAFEYLSEEGSVGKVFYALAFYDGDLILYKPPTGFTVEAWLEKLDADRADQALEAVRGELAAIDAVPAE